MTNFPKGSFSRREFLGYAAGGFVLGALASSRVGAAVTRLPVRPPVSDAPRALVLIHLQGGNDGLNTIVPFADDRYYRLRPTIALRRRDLIRLDAVSALPGFLRPLEPLYREGKLAIVRNTGCAHASPSHYRASETWQTASQPAELLFSGWAGRAAESLGLQGKTVRGFYGSISPPRVLAVSPSGPNCMDSSAAFLPAPLSAVDRGVEALLAEIAGNAAARPGQEIYYVPVPGFDTHYDQPSRHAHAWQSFSVALGAYDHALDRRGVSRRVLTIVFSEFGRSAAENQQGGTEHGMAGPLFLLGGSVRGGLYGPTIDLSASGQTADGLVDFRGVVAAITEQWLGVPAGSAVSRAAVQPEFIFFDAAT
jgi:uncharacterized protein (DUF1501 family)